ncbi:MAG TPA: TlpA disulfide reductase family protein, partial [Agriterribacter sp.]|nr:TlpA disulfide reductase family protein [Agriterribacter sp.]
KQVRLNIFNILFDEKKIDKAFMDFMQVNLDYYHASIMSEVISGKYAFTQLSIEHPQYKSSFPADFAALWEKLYKQYPVSFPAALETYGYNGGFNVYAGNYVNGYISWLRNKNKIVPPPMNWAAGMKDLFQAIQSNLSPVAAEYMEAGILFTELNREKNYPELLRFTADFKRRYPKSSYTAYLDPLIARANAYNRTISTDYTSDQKIIPGYAAISSFGALMAPFRGKTVFIEYWASWCITCKDQFSYEKELQQFLLQKGVEHLFISVDDQHHEDEWKSMIKYYDLKGSHIRANEALLKQLSGIFWSGKGYALPLYVIIGTDGNIREYDALGPSEKKKLYQQIQQYVQ